MSTSTSRPSLRLADTATDRPADLEAADTDGQDGGATAEPARAHRRRRRWWGVGAGALVTVVAAGWVVGQHVQSPSQAASNAASPSPSWITATVEHRVLAQTVISRGDVHPEVAIPIGVPTSTEGSPVVTAIGISVGAEVTEGTRVAEVSGRPVFVLQGEVPVYRPLKPLMVGTDVEQLQRALGRLGCDTSADGGVYGEATKACVARFYADAGYTPIPTSPTDEADIAAATQALIDAQTGIDSAQLTLDRAQRGPSDEEILAADTALNAAQRAYNDAVASGDVAVAQALDAVTRAQAALDELRNSPEATPADVLAAENEVAAANGALDSARRGRQSTIADAIDAITLSQSPATRSICRRTRLSSSWRSDRPQPPAIVPKQHSTRFAQLPARPCPRVKSCSVRRCPHGRNGSSPLSAHSIAPRQTVRWPLVVAPGTSWPHWLLASWSCR